jgi:hypothetical protein
MVVFVSQFCYPFSWIWGHIWCISIPSQLWLCLPSFFRLKKTYDHSESPVISRGYLCCVYNFFIEVGWNCEWIERVKPQNQRQGFTRIRIDTTDSRRPCETYRFPLYVRRHHAAHCNIQKASSRAAKSFSAVGAFCTGYQAVFKNLIEVHPSTDLIVTLTLILLCTNLVTF